MYEKHIDQLSLPQAKWLQCETGLKKHENKEQIKTHHETPICKNHKVVQEPMYRIPHPALDT